MVEIVDISTISELCFAYVFICKLSFFVYNRSATVSLVLRQDSRQNDLLKYFKESFIDEEFAGDSEVTDAASETKPNLLSDSGSKNLSLCILTVLLLYPMLQWNSRLNFKTTCLYESLLISGRLS